MENKYNGYDNNERAFEEYDDFLGSLIAKYNLDEKDFNILFRFAMDHLYKANLLETIGAFFRKNEKDLLNMEKYASDLTDQYLDRLFEKYEDGEPTFKNIPSIKGHEGEF